MALQTIRLRDAAFSVGAEVTFGTNPGSLTRCYPVAGTVEPAPETAELEVNDLTVELYDYKDPVKGLQGGTLKFTCYLRPDATQVGATTTATTPWLGLLLRLALGGEFPVSGTANAGATVATPGSATSNTLTGGHGARVSKGQIVAATVSGSTEPSRIVNVATDTVTNNPAFSAVPSAAPLYALYNYYPTQAPPASFSCQFALAGDSTQQWTFVGCVMTDVEFKLERGQIPTVTFTAKIGKTTGPSAQSVSVAVGSSAMNPPFALKDLTVILQPVATTTRVSRSINAFTLKCALGTDHIEELAGAVEGRSGVKRTGDRPFVTATVKERPDTAYGSTNPDADWWTSRTPLQCMVMDPAGALTAKQWLVFDLPTAVLVGKPKALVNVQDYQAYEYTLNAKIGTGITSPTSGNDLHRTPFVVAIG